MLFLLQAMLSLILAVSIWRSGMIPGKLVILACLVLLTVLLLSRYLLGRKKNYWYIGAAFSAAACLVLTVGTVYVSQTIGLFASASADYKTDDMVVVVRADDGAQSLVDAKDYLFGVQTGVDSANTKAMLENITTRLGQDINVVEFSTPIEEAQALLNEEIGAAIYNNSYAAVIGDVISDYESQVRQIYNYGINTQLAGEVVDPGEPFNVLISGIDTRENVLENSRSDVNIVITINPKTKKVLMTSTPRDYYVELVGVNSYGARDKLTHAGIYGVDVSKATIESIYGIDISYYIRVNFNTLVDIVNAVGGIDVYVDEAFHAYTNSRLYFGVGWHHMDGIEALAYCRERYSFADGDNQRVKNQQKVLKALILKITSPSVLVNAGELLSSMEGAFQTDIPQSKISEMINQQLSDSTPWKIYKQNAASGKIDMQPTYSGGSTLLSVTWPDPYSVMQCTSRIRMVEAERGEEKTP